MSLGFLFLLLDSVNSGDSSISTSIYSFQTEEWTPGHPYPHVSYGTTVVNTINIFKTWMSFESGQYFVYSPEDQTWKRVYQGDDFDINMVIADIVLI